MTYECTVCGEGATVWTGSFFDCTGGEIILRHRLFEGTSATGECNNGAVIANSIGVIDINCSRCYSSQIHFSADNDKNNKTIMCLHVDGTTETVVDTASVIITTGIYMIKPIM